jgi:hypothetical protein
VSRPGLTVSRHPNDSVTPEGSVEPGYSGRTVAILVNRWLRLVREYTATGSPVNGGHVPGGGGHRFGMSCITTVPLRTTRPPRWTVAEPCKLTVRDSSEEADANPVRPAATTARLKATRCIPWIVTRHLATVKLWDSHLPESPHA